MATFQIPLDHLSLCGMNAVECCRYDREGAVATVMCRNSMIASPWVKRSLPHWLSVQPARRGIHEQAKTERNRSKIWNCAHQILAKMDTSKRPARSTKSRCKRTVRSGNAIATHRRCHTSQLLEPYIRETILYQLLTRSPPKRYSFCLC